MREHILNTLPAYFDAIETGEKNFEVRRNDRGFQKGDTLVLRRLNNHDGTGGYTYASYSINAKIKELRRIISYVLPGGYFGVEPGFVVMGLSDSEPPKAAEPFAAEIERLRAQLAALQAPLEDEGKWVDLMSNVHGEEAFNGDPREIMADAFTAITPMIRSVRAKALEDAATRIMPTNDPNDWTDYAKTRAEAAASIRAMKDNADDQ